jgi:hypothetical protein
MGVDRPGSGIRSVDVRSRVLLRVATVGLVAVLISVTGGAIWAAAAVDAAVQEIERISGQGDAWPGRTARSASKSRLAMHTWRIPRETYSWRFEEPTGRSPPPWTT